MKDGGSLLIGYMEDEIHFRLKYEIKIALNDEIQVNRISDRKCIVLVF